MNEESKQTKERITLTVEVEFAGFDAGSCTAHIKREEDETLSRDAKSLQTAMMLAIGKALNDLFGNLGQEEDEAEA